MYHMVHRVDIPKTTHKHSHLDTKTCRLTHECRHLRRYTHTCTHAHNVIERKKRRERQRVIGERDRAICPAWIAEIHKSQTK